ncbi:2-dehydro-3-deoxyphosphogluconate aldolase/(4S)-4-hydroxy-2-oxoglutarate aldolase [Catalinimonas alkaloidigena]|uniref:bifunctional 4-hydroxy-2-oxoglutarate aldolase/2-dehydro-3-deoxy-phosphogluconate aldolase n=1 Tax=Catalinimonas alkaloidigena TaxID=1075417 RepID=UPI0024065557|nr:bifunctional 4-hydroxy-2-oxoglutarate aldolase/2-dehydro-3-deoxy-phosphogluconate aldolase [Catalinimonas alkaloidigena]MDF9799282.1 2-dehydro-3-deoxyphosphogluconate aldolase/(4S)-4-hydroxy-2-oxoglutarate aldolase [Catalinimonas alkaloidigena]
MAQFTRIEVALTMKETGIVPVFYHSDLEVCKQVAKACYEGGVRVFEFTNRGDFAHEVFRELNRYVSDALPEMIMGVGSVVDGGTTSLYLQLGANFIVSPILNPEMAKVCNRRKVAWSPGCGSLSEISYAEELGAEVVKIFPGSQVGGPSFIKAVKGPFPWTSIMPTGGVTPAEENLKAWFEAGAHCVGMGSQLITKEILAENKYSALAEKVSEAIAIAKKYKT